MHLDSSPAVARRRAESRRRRDACSKPRTATAEASAKRPQAGAAAARRIRLDDAIVSQWLLEQAVSAQR
jgi:hypothetical protein